MTGNNWAIGDAHNKHEQTTDASRVDAQQMHKGILKSQQSIV